MNCWNDRPTVMCAQTSCKGDTEISVLPLANRREHGSNEAKGIRTFPPCMMGRAGRPDTYIVTTYVHTSPPAVQFSRFRDMRSVI